MTNYRAWHLQSRPEGEPTAQNFALVAESLPDLQDGQILVENLYLSVDPYMRGRMNDGKSYIPPFALNQAMTGGALGRVVRSRSPLWQEGDLVDHFLGWREAAVLKEKDGRKVQEIPGVPLSAWLGVLGMPGLTAYAGLLEVGRLQPGERVFVSGAAGAVGSLVGQIARIKGCYVVGSCGSDMKAEYLEKELGFDKALNYKKAPIGKLLQEVAGDGFDVYFDNVGGDHLEAAIDQMRKKGRLALCGAIAGYNDSSKAPGPRNLIRLVGWSLTMQGFLVGDYAALAPQCVRDMSGWIKEGKIKFRETTYEGLEKTPEAFLGLFRGENAGKALVHIART